MNHELIAEYLKQIDLAENEHSPWRRRDYADGLVDILRDIFTDDELKTLVQAKADGRLVVLPVKVGDTVYEIVDSVDMPYVRQEKVIAIELWNKNGAMTMFIRTPYGLFEFDKTAFLTREEAEKALGGAEDVTSMGD